MNDLLGTPLHPKAQLRMIAESCGALDEYEDWLTVLKKKKAASTQTSWKRRLKKVRDLITSGNDMREVWERSADSGWTGLFPVRREEARQEPEYDMSLARPGESMDQFITRMQMTR